MGWMAVSRLRVTASHRRNALNRVGKAHKAKGKSYVRPARASSTKEKDKSRRNKSCCACCKV